MRRYSLLLAASCPDAAIEAVLRDPSGLASFADDVAEVRLDGELSHWELNFRGKPLRWTQRDSMSADGNRNDFVQIDGDFTQMHGSWEVSVEQGRRVVRVDYEFHTGMAHLAGAVDPVVARVLLRSFLALVEGLGHDVRVLNGDDLLHDLPYLGAGGPDGPDPADAPVTAGTAATLRGGGTAAVSTVDAVR